MDQQKVTPETLDKSNNRIDQVIQERQLQLSELPDLPPDQKFSKLMFPFTRRGRRIDNTKAICQAKIDWTTIWLGRREDRVDAAINTESQRFRTLPIHEAFNILSNRQLQLWLNNVQDVGSKLKADINLNEASGFIGQAPTGKPLSKTVEDWSHLGAIPKQKRKDVSSLEENNLFQWFEVR